MTALRVPVDDDGAGALRVAGARYLLVRPETLTGLQRAAEAALGPRAAECVAAGGRAGGARASAALVGDAAARARRLADTAATIGWGAFTLDRFGPDGFAVSVRNSPFAEAYGRADGPVCHLIRGVLESLAAATLAGRHRVVERACAAAGADVCRFETVADADGVAS